MHLCLIHHLLRCAELLCIFVHFPENCLKFAPCQIRDCCLYRIVESLFHETKNGCYWILNRIERLVVKNKKALRSTLSVKGSSPLIFFSSIAKGAMNVTLLTAVDVSALTIIAPADLSN